MGALKTLIFVGLVFSGMVTGRAADFRLVNNQFTHVYTNMLPFSGTNGVIVTNVQGTAESIYHTFHFVYAPVGSNTISIVTERTLDGSDYFPVATNTLTAAGLIETNYIGKWVNYRFRATFNNTNSAALNFYYMSQ